MYQDREPKTVTNAALAKLPLFATDLEIAIAIVGKQNASQWKRNVIPILETKGFPKYDPLHSGRPVPLVKQFYALYFGITHGYTLAPPPYREEALELDRKTKSSKLSTPIDADSQPSKDEIRRAQAKANSEAWAAKKKKALEDFRAAKAAKKLE